MLLQGPSASAWFLLRCTILPQAFTVCFSVMATNVVGMIWSYRAKQYKVGGLAGRVVKIEIAGTPLCRTLRKRDTSLMRTLSAVPLHRAVHKSTSELGTPLYTGQPAGSQWCPL